ncbi:MAG: alpha/beta fold hydrolase [Anaerolineales bacterium]|nr:alpha/beta fold hydrolase [Anaerolineales bacterium]
MTTSSASDTRTWGHRWLWWLLGILIALVLIAYFAIGAVAANLLTMPQRDFDPDQTPALLGLEYRDVSFPARGEHMAIAGWYIPEPESTTGDPRAVIMVHGRDASRTAAVTGNFTKLAKALHDAGLAVLMIDLRGHGQSANARFSFGLRERNDVLGAVDYLRQEGFQPGQIGVLGLSLGAAAGIGAAAEDPAIGALVTDSAFADINTLIAEQWDNASGLPRPFLYAALSMAHLLVGEDLTQARPVEEIGRIAPRPLLMIHCQADDYIPVENLTALAAAAPGAETWVITSPDCHHSEGFNVDPAAYAARVTTFFEQGLP